MNKKQVLDAFHVIEKTCEAANKAGILQGLKDSVILKGALDLLGSVVSSIPDDKTAADPNVEPEFVGRAAQIAHEQSRASAGS